VSFISIKNLFYDYITRDENDQIVDVHHALKGLTLDIAEGDFVAVLGRNGSGKSTLAKQLDGIVLPTEGDVVVLTMNTKDEDSLLDIRRNVGMVFQNPDNQIIANVVEEDVAFGPENLGVPTDDIEKRVTKALETVGMTAFRYKSPNKLSGGQKQRVAIAGVMAMKPRCIVLDEPTAMLDPNGRSEIIETITELNKRDRLTIVLITHYMEEAIYANRVVVVDGGKAVMDDTPESIFSQSEKLHSLGLDVPKVTELADELRSRGVPLREGIIDIETFADEVAKLTRS